MVYDYAIIGAGASGLQLALKMTQDDFFADKQILILEKDSKTINDKTWSFWEKSTGQYDEILAHKWETALFYGGNNSLEIPLGDYSYKTLRALDFYNYAKNKLQHFSNVIWKQDKVTRIDENEIVTIFAEEQYLARQVFDSRIPISNEELKQSNGVLQHFLGWEIKTEEEVFDPTRFTMMDYRIKHKDTASFTYVLPFSKTEALVEFTFFSPELVKKEEYEKLIKQYIEEKLHIVNYTITAIESGVIPMFDYPFHKYNTEKILKIGTAGGWLKASSGYSFKSSNNKSKKLVENIKHNRSLSHNLHAKRHALYDSTFLRVLEKENHLGEDLFTIMYSKNDIETVFAFLDEETTFSQEVALMSTFPKVKFGLSMMYALLSAGKS